MVKADMDAGKPRKAQSVVTLKRDEERGHSRVADSGQSPDAPSSPQSTWSKADVKPETDTDRDGTGQEFDAGNGHASFAHPVRETNDGEAGQPPFASNGHFADAPSSSAPTIGDNISKFPDQEVTQTVFDQAKMNAAQSSMKEGMAAWVRQNWQLSDQRSPLRVEIKDLLLLVRDSVAARVLLKKIRERCANGLQDIMHMYPDDILTDEDIEECYHQTREAQKSEHEARQIEFGAA
jgi:hypothetical protein